MVYVNGRGVPYEGQYVIGDGFIPTPFFYGMDFSDEENSMYLGIIGGNLG